MPAPPLQTGRLLLRQITVEDAASLHHALSDAEAMTWWSSAPHKTIAETQAYVARNAEESEGWRCWAITEDGAVAIGWVVLIEKRPGVQEIGYILRRDFWGKGVAREAVSAVIQFGFSVLKLRRIFADTDPDNAASVALLTALGFREEGHLRAEWHTHIGIRDSLIFGLLREEWRRA